LRIRQNVNEKRPKLESCLLKPSVPASVPETAGVALLVQLSRRPRFRFVNAGFKRPNMPGPARGLGLASGSPRDRTVEVHRHLLDEATSILT